jgi:hypothetical protein
LLLVELLARFISIGDAGTDLEVDPIELGHDPLQKLPPVLSITG